tara:strand:+ start:28 stop:753 length:726 start_codon:yes stop_codon:yes gene_type:complete
MKTNYFNSSLIKPLVKASTQHAAFNVGEIVFDWTGFEIPRGTAKLLGATIKIRAKGDAGQTVQPNGINLLFAKGPTPDATPTSLGTAGAEVTNFASTDIVGAMPSVSTDSFGLRTLYQSTVSSSELVLEPNSNSGANVGVDKYYVAGLAAGAMDFTSLLTVNETNFGAASQTVITTADLDPRLNLAPGDVVHANDDAVLGTILTVDNATQITLTAANTAAIANDDVLYNVNPIEIILHFSK